MSGEKEGTELIDDLNEDEKAPLLANSESSSSITLSRSPSPESESESESEPTTDPRFVQPTPSRLKRTCLLIFLALLFWLAFSMRANLLDTKRKRVKIIHASRYSKEHKFRPAASPIVTETLKDGRVRLRGAIPEPTPPPVSPVVKKKRKTSAGKVSGKRKFGGNKSKPKPRAVNQQRA